MLTNCLEMHVLGANWQARQSMVSQSPNGHKLVTDDWQHKSQTFIERETAVKIFMWEMQHNIVHWVYFKTQILLATLRTQNYVFLDAEHLYQFAGCARIKRQYHTVPQNRKSCRQMLDCEGMDYLLSIYGIW